MSDKITVLEVEEPVVEWDRAEFVCTDARLNPDETVDGHTLIHLTNGRTLRIAWGGIFDETDTSMDSPPSVNWDELLQLLDAFRENRRQSEVN